MFRRKRSKKVPTPSDSGRVAGFTYRKVPKSYFDLTTEEQFEWLRELLEGIRPVEQTKD